MVGFGGVEEAGVRRGDEFARGVREVDARLLDLCAKTREGEDAEVVANDTDQAFRTELGGETPGVVESVEDEGSELEDAAVGVVEPRSTREGENGGRTLDGDAGKLDRSGTEEPAGARSVNRSREEEEDVATHLVRVSPREPLSGSRTVRRRTPF